jgi:N,N-dimethylformamidase
VSTAGSDGRELKSVVGYANAWSVAPGDRLEVKVSTYGEPRYRADLVRVICGDDEPDHAIYREEEIPATFSGDYPGRTQVMAAGSYVVVPAAELLGSLSSFTAQTWVLPTTPDSGEQGLVSRWDPETSTGFALHIDASGALALRLGETVISTETALAARRWHLVSASYDAETGTAHLHQHRLGSPIEPSSDASATGGAEAGRGGCTAALLMAALPAADERFGSACSHLNGKLDRPRLTARVLTREEIDSLAWDAAPHEGERDVVAAWDFSLDIGTDRVTDLGPNGLHGHTVNLPSRGVKGFNWSGDEHNWHHAREEYGAIHFHEDDHYDAGWDTDFDFVVPDAFRSGVYAVRLRAGDDDWYIPFFVRPPNGAATSKLAFLASTATYMAYSNYRWPTHNRYAEVAESIWTTLDRSDAFLAEHPEFGMSTYDTHFDGSGVRYASRLRPVLNAAPKTPLWSLNADTHILGWLEHCGIDYDVITDEDLHREGAPLLDRYRAVLTGTHPEYYTTPMWDGLRSYIEHGGRLVYLGGNGFIWRCAFSDRFPGALELRRAEDGIRYRDEEPGEYYLEFTGEYGGLWRRLGTSPQELVGVGTVAVGFDASGWYRRTPASLDPRVAFVFEGIGWEEPIGDFGILGGGASGSEIDAVDPVLGTPPHTLVIARSEGHSANTYLVPDETGFHHSAMDGLQNPRVHADMTFFETPGGGAVFSVGSIAWGASLPHNTYDNNVARLSENVLRRFLAEAPFHMP